METRKLNVIIKSTIEPFDVADDLRELAQEMGFYGDGIDIAGTYSCYFKIYRNEESYDNCEDPIFEVRVADHTKPSHFTGNVVKYQASTIEIYDNLITCHGIKKASQYLKSELKKLS